MDYDEIEILLKNKNASSWLPIYINVFDTPLAIKWLNALNSIMEKDLHLEKNYHFLGVPVHERGINYITQKINDSIEEINNAQLGYTINEYFSPSNTVRAGSVGEDQPGATLIHEKMNRLHRYFEDLQGISGHMSNYYNKADPYVKWHIRQLNLLCHEYESLVLSIRKRSYAPEWMRPSELFCFLNAPRFRLDEEDYESFGVETLARPLGGVFVGVNKAVGKHHWEVFKDEGGRSIDELTTSAMRSQTEACGDFDIEWANDPGQFQWMQDDLNNFRRWLIKNGFDPNDKSLTIGHPQVGQVDLLRSFGSTDYKVIWDKLFKHLDVYSIKTSSNLATYKYSWDDPNYMDQQVKALYGV